MYFRQIFLSLLSLNTCINFLQFPQMLFGEQEKDEACFAIAHVDGKNGKNCKIKFTVKKPAAVVAGSLP